MGYVSHRLSLLCRMQVLTTRLDSRTRIRQHILRQVTPLIRRRRRTTPSTLLRMVNLPAPATTLNNRLRATTTVHRIHRLARLNRNRSTPSPPPPLLDCMRWNESES